jgi:hypothetical protein
MFTRFQQNEMAQMSPAPAAAPLPPPTLKGSSGGTIPAPLNGSLRLRRSMKRQGGWIGLCGRTGGSGGSFLRGDMNFRITYERTEERIRGGISHFLASDAALARINCPARGRPKWLGFLRDGWLCSRSSNG